MARHLCLRAHSVRPRAPTWFWLGRALCFAALSGACVCLSASALWASTIDIQFSGLNLVYDGTNLYDADTSNTARHDDPAEADPLDTVSFYVDGSLTGSVLTSNIFADIFIKNVLSIPVGGGTVTTGGNADAFGFDIFTHSTTPGYGIDLNLNQLEVLYINVQNQVRIAAGGGLAASLVAQDLPFGLVFDSNQSITLAFSSALLTNVTSSEGFLTGFNFFGTGSISGTLVPEPSTGALLGVGLAVLGCAAYVRRRKRA